MDFENRPKLTISLSNLDKKIELLSKLFLGILWAITLVAFFNLPDIIPTHFNAKGEVDDYGSKLTLFILPVIATLLYLLLTLINKYPHVFNYPTTITSQNAEQQYTFATKMLRYVKLAIILIFSGITLFTFLTSKGIANGLGWWFLPLCFCLLYLPIVVAIYFSVRKKSNEKVV